MARSRRSINSGVKCKLTGSRGAKLNTKYICKYVSQAPALVGTWLRPGSGREGWDWWEVKGVVEREERGDKGKRIIIMVII